MRRPLVQVWDFSREVTPRVVTLPPRSVTTPGHWVWRRTLVTALFSVHPYLLADTTGPVVGPNSLPPR